MSSSDEQVVVDVVARLAREPVGARDVGEHLEAGVVAQHVRTSTSRSAGTVTTSMSMPGDDVESDIGKPFTKFRGERRVVGHRASYLALPSLRGSSWI